MIKVFYHANCADGFCAANIFHGHMPNAEYIPIHYGVNFNFDIFSPADEVFFIDYSRPRAELIHLAKLVKNVVVLDHHKTAKDDLQDLAERNLTVYFDMDRSGAMMAWDYVNYVIDPHPRSFTLGELPHYTPVPKIVSYVQDRDLWQWKLPHSKEINMYIRTFPFDFEAWKRLDYNINNDFLRCVDIGEGVLKYQQREIENAVRNAVEAELVVPGMGAFVIPTTNSTVNFSEVAGELAIGRSFAVVWFRRGDGKYQYSLRSEPNFDCAEIARAFGGGGHPQAAGFEHDNLVLSYRI